VGRHNQLGRRNPRELLQSCSGKNAIHCTVWHITVTISELKSVLKATTQSIQTKQGYGFKEVRSRKRHNIEEAAHTSKKATLLRASVQVATRNFFSLRTPNMDTDATGTESNATEGTISGKSGSPLQ
jgi:hypothetical protein